MELFYGLILRTKFKLFGGEEFNWSLFFSIPSSKHASKLELLISSLQNPFRLDRKEEVYSIDLKSSNSADILGFVPPNTP